MKKIIVMIFIAYLLSPLVSADVLVGKINFDKRPAKAGVIYEVKHNYQTVNSAINQQSKQFTEMIGVSSHQGKLSLLNNDEFEHNIFANDIKQNIQFDVGLMSPGSKQEIVADWQTNTVVRIGCKIHPKMRSYIANIPSDNYASFEFDKKQQSTPFELNEIAGDSNQFILLLAGMDNTEVTIAKGETKTIDILRKGQKKGSINLTRS